MLEKNPLPSSNSNITQCPPKLDADWIGYGKRRPIIPLYSDKERDYSSGKICEHQLQKKGRQ
jgi:hypothetical protein